MPESGQSDRLGEHGRRAGHEGGDRLGGRQRDVDAHGDQHGHQTVGLTLTGRPRGPGEKVARALVTTSSAADDDA